MKFLAFTLLITLMSTGFSQSNDQASEELPYRQISDYPENFSSGNLVSRMIDGLGFRYYWATEGLRQEDLNYAPSEGARSTLETMQHIYGLTSMVLNATLSQPNQGGSDASKMDYETLRKETLMNIQQASEQMLGKSAEEIEKMLIIFQRGEQKQEIPFWNVLNGPLADAIYHTGQIVSFRRASGNPMNPKVSVFSGTVRE